MIQAVKLTKRFEDITAVDHIDAAIREGSVFGLIGTNGAGKSTFLRLASGILKPDEGHITIDGQEVFENPAAKRMVFYISDEAYFFSNASPLDMMAYYSRVYERFDKERFRRLLKSFGLDEKRRIHTFSKGMKKQVSVICGICANTKYLFCDETFDGLDPVMRQAVKSLFASELLNRNFTPIIASHSLRELEDICDQIGLIHNGHLLFTQDLDTLKCNLCKVQCVIPDPAKEEQLLSRLPILQYEKSGSLLTITARGLREDILRRVNETEPLFAEILPLSLEEIFISEMEVEGYDVKDLLF